MLYIAAIASAFAVICAFLARRAYQRIAALEAELSALGKDARQAEEHAARAQFLTSAVELALTGQLTREMFEQERLFLDLDGAAAARLVESEPALQILDVRSGAEFKSGHLPAARSLPIDQLEGQWASLPRDKPYLVYCAMGSRSAAAATLLTHHGFRRVYNLEAGIGSWPGPRSC